MIMHNSVFSFLSSNILNSLPSFFQCLTLIVCLSLSALLSNISHPITFNFELKCYVLNLLYTGIGWTSWKKRWFVLTRASLVFFRSDPVRYIVPIYCTISLDAVPFSLCYTVGYLYLFVFIYIIIHTSALCDILFICLRQNQFSCNEKH